VDVETLIAPESAPGEVGEPPLNSSPAVLELRQQAESMFAELSQLRERNDVLAWALGACGLCWGEDEQCRACRGRGRPGFAIPDRQKFAQYVLPAARMLQVKRKKTRPRKRT
jgi:hypothetical protein